MDQNIFNNPSIVIGNSMIAPESLGWKSSGFELASNILNEGDKPSNKYYICSTFEVPVSQNKWVEFFHFLECVDWRNICLSVIQNSY